MPDLLATLAEQDSMGKSRQSNSRTCVGQWELSLAVEPRSIEHVRRILRAQLHYWGRTDVEFVALLGTTELLTNVLKHTEDRQAVVRVRVTADAVVVTVRDFDDRLPQIRAVESLAEDGRGLPLLRSLADAMGMAASTTGKDVWFRLDCAGLPQDAADESE
ncbi:ATP-binding protein [Streptantibioticus ferralitis]|uniref:ATP-binding protein n=1 Tax=Streptantibioticus ferralitis TaxID=236510 RepID=A0ABT5Z5Q8_9ACTN|nr:ATP-binding protein [Streptantibioticus ferralitis]MDF2258390.1 ATP-binding protein [Streptantibioticus ferralitis]